MVLEKNDLKQIEKIVLASEKRLESRLETRIVKKIDQKIDNKIDQAKSEIIAVLSKEIDGIAEINREFINRIDNHESRIVKIEGKIGLSKV